MPSIGMISVNFNMDHIMRQNIEYVRRCVKSPIDIFVLDQSSEEKYRFTSEDAVKNEVHLLQSNTNVHAGHGFNLILQLADSYTAYNDLPAYDYYLVSVTSALMDPEGDRTDDVFTPCLEFLESNEDAVMCQPVYRADSDAANLHLFNQGTGKPRQVQHLEYCAALFRGDWFREIGGWAAEMKIHGHDLWFSYLARLDEKTMWVHEGVEIKRDQDNGYANERVGDSRMERANIAMQTFAPFAHAMLGPNWWPALWYQHSTDPNWVSPQCPRPPGW